MAAITPRADRVIDLINLRDGGRYLNIGCGTSAFAHLLAARAGHTEVPVCMDLVGEPGPVDLVAWPEKLPFPDNSFDHITSLYFIRRFDDDV
ncbi:MAG: methyltransferase domain-containing protein, partial [Dehalococcoidia bacterium]|nr:methyltransferase domain-containing protein [Dehalococcoidia bacterium]